MKPLVLLVGHGSRDNSFVRPFKKLVRRYQTQHPSFSVQCGFLEFAKPSLEKSLRKAAQNLSSITVLPVFLFTARHLKKDIPAVILKIRKEFPGVKVNLAPALGVHPLLTSLIYDRIKAKSPLKNQRVILVGRGASDPGVKKEFFKLARLFGKKYGFAEVKPCFYDMLKPTLPETLAQASPSSTIVMPYLLFKGRVFENIGKIVNSFSQAAGKKSIPLAEVLGADPKILKVLALRLAEAAKK